jgi:hypothetical protein
MTGPGHYREAERLTDHVQGLIESGDTSGLAPLSASLAQVHATLANAAAAAIGSGGSEEWYWFNAAGSGGRD